MPDDPPTLPALPDASSISICRPTALPADAHLKGADNYAVWAVQMRGLVGNDTWQVMSLGIPKPDPTTTTVLRANPYTYSDGVRLNDFAMTSIIISCSHSVIHHVATCNHNTNKYWVALRSAFVPTDAQGALRLLSRFWSLSLPSASPEAYDTFAQEYKATLSALKTAKVDLEMVYSSHLLTALPSSLAALQTTIAVSNPSSLPSTESILELVRNKILRSATVSSLSTALLAAQPSTPKAPRPQPSPCPACQTNHWLRDWPCKAEYRRQQQDKHASARLAISPAPDPAPASASYTQVAADGVEAWYGGVASPSRLTQPSRPHRTLSAAG